MSKENISWAFTIRVKVLVVVTECPRCQPSTKMIADASLSRSMFSFNVAPCPHAIHWRHGGSCCWMKNAHTGNRTQVTSMGGLYDATTLCVLLTVEVGKIVAECFLVYAGRHRSTSYYALINFFGRWPWYERCVGKIRMLLIWMFAAVALPRQRLCEVCGLERGSSQSDYVCFAMFVINGSLTYDVMLFDPNRCFIGQLMRKKQEPIECGMMSAGMGLEVRKTSHRSPLKKS